MKPVMFSLRSLRSFLLLLCAVFLPGCTSLRHSLSDEFLIPPGRWLAEPSDLGLSFDEFDLPTGRGTGVHGWFVRAPGGDGRTVVLCHGAGSNISFYHPYLSFLTAAGWHVALFDYRGFGHSPGRLDVASLLPDTRAVLEHVRGLPEVDARRIALYGISLGAIVAFGVAREEPGIAAVVVEDLSSPRTALRNLLGGFTAWFVRVLAVPSGLEPKDNAARIAAPCLSLVGEWDPDLHDHLDAMSAARHLHQTWVMESTAHAPHSLLVQDGAYQTAVVRFLDSVVDGSFSWIETHLDEADEASTERRVTLTWHGSGAFSTCAVELALVPESGAASFVRRWMNEPTERWSIEDFAAPKWCSAFVAPKVEMAPGTVPGTTPWQPKLGPLARVRDQREFVHAIAQNVLLGDDLEAARAYVETLSELESRFEIPALLATEWIPDHWSVADLLTRSADPEDVAAGRSLLLRILAAEPKVPGLHYWPGLPYVAGFEHGEIVVQARERLAELDAAR